MNILFICKHNRFRSKVAEAFFRKYNKNKKYKVRSRGMLRDINVAKNVIKALKERGVKLRSKRSICMTKNDERWANLIVVVANNVNIGFEKKTIIWKIRDTNQYNLNEIRRIVVEIEKRIKNLISKL